MSFPAEIFKAYDIRGKVGSELTPEVAEKVGAALGTWLPEQGAVAVGYDMRPDSKALAEGLIAGLTLVGRDVWNIGQVASDMIYFTVGNFQLAGGAMVTASHNPGDDNGVKMCREKAGPIGSSSGLLEVRGLAIENNPQVSASPGKVIEKDVMSDWIKYALSFVEPSQWPAYNVVVDAGNGMAGAVVPHLEKHVPIKIDPMYFELDGTFPNHIANPVVPENLVDIQNRIKETGADFGIAFDGDGDRAVAIDENGEALSGTVTTAILAEYLLKRQPGSTVLYNAVTGRVAPDTVERLGGKSYRTKVGHSYIKADMRQYNAVFAGESSGHYYLRDNYHADSGLIAALIIVQAVAESGKTLSQLARQYREAYQSIPESNFEVSDKEAALERVKNHYAGENIDELDGVTVNFDDGWINVRPSNTESLLRLNAEAKTSQRLEELVAEAKSLIHSN